jgi:DNA mismatch endonuclease (patch repair protein)
MGVRLSSRGPTLLKPTAARSRIMRAIKSRNTRPELLVRRLAHHLGFRFRLCRKDMPGCPDIVFPRLRKVIFVHGCFWHCHDCSGDPRVPSRNRDYWLQKLERNKARDAQAREALTTMGWKVTVFWECELQDQDRAIRKLKTFLR